MGSSYTKQENEFQYREIPIDNDSPWEFAECFYESYWELRDQVKDLKKELILLKNNPHLKNPSPKFKSHRNQINTGMTDIWCQAKDKSAMEIEPQAGSPRRMVRCTSLRKKIFYTKVYVKIHVKREDMEIEKEKIAHHPKSKQKIPENTQKFVKIFARKDGMEIEY